MLEKLKEDYPEALHLDNRVGFELLLPAFNESCRFVGDVSSALFAIKWFKPNYRVLAVDIEQSSPTHFDAPLKPQFKSIDIPKISDQSLEGAL